MNYTLLEGRGGLSHCHQLSALHRVKMRYLLSGQCLEWGQQWVLPHLKEIILSVFVAVEDMNTDPEKSVGKVIKRGESGFLPFPEWALHLELELSDFASAPWVSDHNLTTGRFPISQVEKKISPPFFGDLLGYSWIYAWLVPKLVSTW